MTSPTCCESPVPPPKAVLVVDADPLVTSMISRVITSAGWIMQAAPDNRAVLEWIERRPFDLIITGERTSAKEDIELLRKIRRVRPHTRMIVLTDASTPEEVIDCMRERAFSYFSRPFSLDSLAEMVRIAMDRPCWDDGIEIISATPAWVRLVTRCDMGTADRLMQFLNEISDFPDPEKAEVAVAFREMLLNAIEHGGQFDPSQYVEISYVRMQRLVLCRIRDPGKGFSREDVLHAAISNPSDDPIRHVSLRQERNLRPGGYGVLIARHLVDELIYSEKGNEVLLVKYLDGGAAQSPQS
jgi:DNA-binding response OmpR family regulator